MRAEESGRGTPCSNSCGADAAKLRVESPSPITSLGPPVGREGVRADLLLVFLGY